MKDGAGSASHYGIQGSLPICDPTADGPKPVGDRTWIDSLLLPPLDFVANAVVLVMMHSAKRDREFIANFYRALTRIEIEPERRFGGRLVVSAVANLGRDAGHRKFESNGRVKQDNRFSTRPVPGGPSAPCSLRISGN
jgi:hypothetical protein